MGTDELLGKPTKLRGSDLRLISIPSRGRRITPSRFMRDKLQQLRTGLAQRLHLMILHRNRVHVLTHLLKFSILLSWISVIESHDHFAVVHVLVILIQQSSLGMTDVEIPEV